MTKYVNKGEATMTHRQRELIVGIARSQAEAHGADAAAIF